MSSNLEDTAQSARPSPAGTAQHIADIWSLVLDRHDLDAGSDFFALGGDSYQVVQVVTLLEERLGFEVPVRLLFQQPTTIAGLTDRIAETRSRAVAGDAPGADGYEVGEI
jgi:acyl carrier protein